MNLLKRFLSWLFGSPLQDRREFPPARQAGTESGPIDAPGAFAPTAAVPTSPPKKLGRSFGLDASDYLPITREEVKQAARGRNLMGNLWFGRRDLIPPADDPRTQLIDRGMVTQGLIAPEQLAEIHAVGAEMDRVRPT